MRTAPLPLTLRAVVAVACLLAAAGPVAAQKKVRIASARVGLPPGPPTAEPVAKFATWAPVYVELELLADVKEPAELVVEAADADEVTTTLAVPLTKLAATTPGQRLTAMSYTRPAGGNRTVTVFVRAVNGAALSEPFRVQNMVTRDPRAYVVLSLGGKLQGFDLPRPAAAGAGPENAPGPLRDGRVALAAITNVEELPDRWIGYDAADLVVLTTSSAGLFNRLADAPPNTPEAARREALLEWVRRGGRLAVSVGGSAEPVARLHGLSGLVPHLNPSREAAAWSVSPLVFDWGTKEGGRLHGVLAPKGTLPIRIANITPRPGGRVLIQARQAGAREQVPLAVQSAYGLGRVTVIGFDLDWPPFTAFDRRAEFWDWVLREAGAARASVGPEGRKGPTAVTADDEDDLAATLRRHVDTFDGVPVVSFGAVAILIVVYLVLIGPAEYYFLRKAFGRLELTWATFPVIVATVCAAAYFTAASVKGRDLRVNKVDVIDVDPASGRVYGTSWLTVFSPKTQTYTVGLTPAEGWTAPNATAETVVGWVGSRQAGRPGLLRRRYQYHTGSGAVADALENVPVQVWATKSFTANWAADLDRTTPVVESRLEHPPGDPEKVIGSFVNRMPFDEIRDCVAFYAGQAYPLQPGGTIYRGQPITLLLDRGQPAVKWLQDEVQPTRGQTGGKAAGPETGGSTLPLWGVLFHEASLKNDEGVFPRNASLRRLDQSWRLTRENRDEVILVGRVLPPPGPAEELLGGPASPTRLWLRGLPGNGPRRPLDGFARQETYVRVYLPVRPAGAGP